MATYNEATYEQAKKLRAKLVRQLRADGIEVPDRAPAKSLRFRSSEQPEPQPTTPSPKREASEPSAFVYNDAVLPVLPFSAMGDAAAAALAAASVAPFFRPQVLKPDAGNAFHMKHRIVDVSPLRFQHHDEKPGSGGRKEHRRAHRPPG